VSAKHICATKGRRTQTGSAAAAATTAAPCSLDFAAAQIASHPAQDLTIPVQPVGHALELTANLAANLVCAEIIEYSGLDGA
jgi:hypothetical protein